MIPSICLAVAGEFGWAVAGLVAARRADLVTVELNARPVANRLPVADRYALVTSRLDEPLGRELDEAAHHWRRPLLTVAMEHPRLRIGPLVSPGAGPCLHCYFSRVRQHNRHLGQLDALAAGYGADPRTGPGGLHPAVARLAADWTLRLLGPARLPADEVGVVRHLDVLRMTVRRTEVTGVHACGRCGLGIPGPERSFARLAPVLAGALDGAR